MRRALSVLPVGLTLWVAGCEPSVNSDLRRQEFANLKQIGFAVHQYDNTHKRFPAAAIHDKSGKPLLSWRVALLPSLGEGELYNQFRVDEPWDSDHNIKLVRQMPDVYLTPGRNNEGKTSIMMFTGEETPFGGSEGPKGSDMPDGTSQTIMCVVAGADKAVRWTKPADLRFHANNPLVAMGKIPNDYFHAILCDGAPVWIPSAIEPETLGRMITHDDGYKVDLTNIQQAAKGRR